MSDLYNLSSHYWGGEMVSLHALSMTGDVFATIPVKFLTTSGVNTWEYILGLANTLVDSVIQSKCEILTREGVKVELRDAPCAGDYVYRPSGRTLLIIWSQTTLTRTQT